MVKTQVQLAEKDLAELRRLAAQEEVSVSELVRRGVKQILTAHQKEAPSERWRRARELAGKFHSGKHDIGRRHDDYLAENLKK